MCGLVVVEKALLRLFDVDRNLPTLETWQVQATEGVLLVGRAPPVMVKGIRAPFWRTTYLVPVGLGV